MQMIKYEGNIFQRIFKRLKSVFIKTKEKEVVQEEKTKDILKIETYKPEIEIAVLAKRLEKKEITKEELTDEEKEKIIEYYKEKNKLLASEIEYKTKKFNDLKREIINYYLKLKEI